LNLLNILGIAVGLAMDAFAVAIAAGLSLPKVTGRHVFRMAWHFGFFQFMMPVVGWMAGETVAARMGGYDHWIAFGLLAYIGGKMLWDACFEDPNARKDQADPTRGWTLVMLSIATSIDALAVGFSLALLNVNIWFPSVIIGLVAGGLTVVGIVFGSRLGARWERRAEAVGGVVLVLIGARIVASHVLGW
jgi:manganese efflux pump family protein